MSAEKFLDRLEQQKLLDAELIADLRQQVAELPDVSVEALAKLLIDNGYLTAFQANKLMNEALSASPREPGPAGAAPKKPPKAARRPPADSESLDLAQLSDEDQPPARPAARPAEEDELVPLDDELEAADGFTPLDEPERRREKSKRKKSRRKSKSGAAVGMYGDPLPDDPLGDPLAELPVTPATTATNPLLGPPRKPGLMGMLGLGGPPRRRTNQWDSPLLLIGGAVLGLLLILFVILYYALAHGSADEMFNAAEEDYRNLSYNQSIAKYDDFLDAFPDHPNASLARVRREMARLHIAVEQSSDPEQGLKAAQEILPTIEAEQSFYEARDELASLLPEIAEGFVERASKAVLNGNMQEAQRYADLVDESMQLVNNPAYIPTTLRKSQESRIAEIQEDVAIVRRDINRDKQLRETIATIEQHVSDGETSEAYARRAELLKLYPGLEGNEQLVETVRSITERQRELVRVTDETPQPLAEDTPPEFPQVVSSQRTGGTVESLQGNVAYVLARGAVFALNAATGEVLWRRYVGHETDFHPVPVSEQPGADALLVDAGRQELLRLQASDGRLVWRLPVGEPFSAPVVSAEQIYVATHGGRLLQVDPATGQSARAAVLPQPLGVGPAVDARRPHVYQVGEHSNLYALNRGSLQCDEVFYLGHKTGSIAVQPAMASGHLFVAENAGRDYSLLHILSVDDSGLSITRPQPPLRLEGRVVVPPVVSGRHVLVVTDRGAIHVYDVDPANATQPVTVVAQLVATSKTPLIGYPLVDGGKLWIGDDRFTHYQIQTSRGQLVRQWIKDDGATVIGPLQQFDDVVLRVRQAEQAPGVQVSAVRGGDATVLWQTDLAVPSVPVPGAEEAAAVNLLSVRGALFELAAVSQRGGYVDEPVESIDADVALTAPLHFADRRMALFDRRGGQHLLIYDPASSDQRLQLLALPVPGGEATALPRPFRNGLLVPLARGQVSFVDLPSATQAMYPFQPPMQAGSQRSWLRPAAIDNDEFLLAADDQHLYRVGVQPGESARLVQRGVERLDFRLVGSLAVAEDTLYGVRREADRDVVVAFQLPDLSIGQQWELSGRVAEGPVARGDVVLVATTRGALSCFAAGQTQRWAVDLGFNTLAAAPVAIDGDFLLVSVDGRLRRIDGKSGSEVASVEVREPLAGAPLVQAQNLYVPGSDGTLHILPPLVAVSEQSVAAR